MQVLVKDQKLSEGLIIRSSTGNKMKILNDIQNLLKAVEIADDENTNNMHKSAHNNTTTELNGEGEHNKKSCLNGNVQSLQSCSRILPGISQLLPSLYLCGAGVAVPHILDELGVSFVINVAPELPDTPLSGTTNPLYLRINAFDRPEVDLSQYFDEVSDMIEEVHQHGGISLVHCVAGVSRSASLCLAYLMKHKAMSLREAYLHVKAIRPQIRPNSGFFQQLRQYEEQLRGTCSVQMVFYESLNKEIPDVYEPEYRAMEEFYQRQRKALKSRRENAKQC